MKGKLARKIFLAFATSIVACLLLGGSSWGTMDRIQERQAQILEKDYVRIRALLGMRSNFLEIEKSALLENLLSDEERNTTEAEKREVIKEHISNVMNSYSLALETDEQIDQLSKMSDLLGKYYTAVDNLSQNQKNSVSLDETAWQEVEAKFNELIAIIEESIYADVASMDEHVANIERLILVSRIVNSIIIIIAFAVTILVSIKFIRDITKSTNSILSGLLKVTDGDLTQEIPIVSQDELGEIAQTSNQVIECLAGMTQEIISVADEVAAASQELLGSAEETSASVEQVTDSMSDLAERTTSQVEAIRETNNSINSVMALVKEVSHNTDNVQESANKMVDIVKNGLIQVETANSTMLQIKDTTDKTAQVVAILGHKSDQIGNFIEVIKGIAQQTNLLALNASIEASHAGEQGKGFAVVADEVKALAQQSSSSAEQISKIVKDIQDEMAVVINAMKESLKEVNVGVEVVDITNQSFNHIAQEIEKVASQIVEVKQAIEQLDVNTNHGQSMIKKVNEVANVHLVTTEEILASSEEQKYATNTVVKSSEELAELANKLLLSVNKFKTK